jgi:digeranylgeranylglycerophospholipid reductase
MYDVIVVGAGCIGSYVARLLAEQGRNVLVLEKDSHIGDSVNCSGIIGAEAFSKMKLPSNSTQTQLQDIKVFGPSGRSVTYQPKKPWAKIVDRAEFDRQMAGMAAESGASYRLDCRVNDVGIDDKGVVLRAQEKGGLKLYRAKACVLATGFGAKFIQNVGLGKIENYIQGVQAFAKMKNVEEVEIYLGKNVAPGSFAWMVPFGDGYCKIGLLADRGGGDLLRRLIESSALSGRLQFWDGSVKASLIPLGSLPKTSAERIIVVGEAAGQIKVTTAGGIYYGLLCAEIASETLGRAFQEDDFSEAFLGDYDANWRALLEPELDAGLALRKKFMEMSDRQIDVILNLSRYNGIVPLVNEVFRFDWHAPLISGLMKNYLDSKTLNPEKI